MRGKNWIVYRVFFCESSSYFFLIDIFMSDRFVLLENVVMGVLSVGNGIRVYSGSKSNFYTVVLYQLLYD